MVKLKEKQEVYVEKEKHTIDELIRILTEKELTEINFEEKEFKIKIKRDLIEEVQPAVVEEAEEIVPEQNENIKNIKC